MPRRKAQVEPFAFTEAELSEEARAILAYARKYAAPFTRMEIVAVAPGAAWDPFARWPSTVAALDPLRELVRAGFIEEHDEQPVKSAGPRSKKTYKRWKLTGADAPLTLAQLLEALLESGAGPDGHADVERYREEILRRFDR